MCNGFHTRLRNKLRTLFDLSLANSLHERKLQILHKKHDCEHKENVVSLTSSSSPLPFSRGVRGLPNLFPIGLVAPDLIKKSFEKLLKPNLLTNLPIDLTFGLFYLG